MAQTDSRAGSVRHCRACVALTVAVLAIVLASCSHAPRQGAAGANDESRRFNAFLAQAFEQDVARSPMLQAFVGLTSDQHRWDDLSQASQDEEIERARRDLARLRARFDPARLSAEDRLSWQLFEHFRQQKIDDGRWRFHEYLLNPLNGWNQRIPATLLSSHSIASVADARSYIARLHAVPDLVDQVLTQTRLSAERGIVAPRFVLEQVSADARLLLRGAPFEPTAPDSALLADFRRKVAALDIGEAERAELLQQAERALRAAFAPAYESIVAACTSLLPRAGTDDGVWQHPDGSEYYAHRLRSSTTTPLNAHDIHNLGLAEVARLQAEIRTVMQQLAFTGTLQEFLASMRADPRFYYPDTDAGRDAYVAEVEQTLRALDRDIHKLVRIVPLSRYVVRRVEAFREAAAPAASFQRATVDGSRPGIYWLNMRDMSLLPRYQLEALAYHEVIPGHHLQSARSIEQPLLPAFRRYARIPAFSEGWGLYAERLPLEIGLYRDPHSRFGLLSTELWRATRLVVDTGIHALRWTREQGVAYLDANTANSHGDNVREVNRYVVWPGQATSYKIGLAAILRTRDAVRQTLGERWRLQDFNDELLRAGTMPLSILDEHMRRWAQERAAGNCADC